MKDFDTFIAENEPQKMEPLSGGKSGAVLALYPGDVKVVLKFVKETSPEGKTCQRGLPIPTLPYREVAFGKLAKLFGPDFAELVPKTTLTRIGKKKASAQLWFHAFHFKELNAGLGDREKAKWVSTFQETASKVDMSVWARLLILDIVGGSRDRHSNNVGLTLKLSGKGQPQFGAIGWDNACSLGRMFVKYHNVIHKYLFRLSVDIDPYWDRLASFTTQQFESALSDYIEPEEIRDAYLRLQFMLDFPYRLPFCVMSQGTDDSHLFPIYRRYFLTPQPHHRSESLHDAVNLG